VGTLLRYPYEVRSEDEYFDEIQDVKVTKDMLDLAKHIVNQKSGAFEPDKFEDHYEAALVDLINSKRSGQPITPKERPRGENVVERREETTEGRGRTEGNADADRREEAVGGEEAGGQTAAQVGVRLRFLGKRHV